MTKQDYFLTNDEINQTQNLLAKAATYFRALAHDHYDPTISDQIEDSLDCSYKAKQMDRVIEALNCLRPKEPVIRKEIKAVHEGGEFTYVFEYTYYDDEIVSQELIFWFFGGLADFDLDDIETLNLRGQLKAEF